MVKRKAPGLNQLTGLRGLVCQMKLLAASANAKQKATIITPVVNNARGANVIT